MQKLKFFRLLLVVIMSAVCFTSCSEDDDEASDLATMIVGKWRITEVEQKDGTMLDVTTYIAEKVFEPTYATFNSNGTYYGSGYFGDGSGTYTVRGKMIYTYVDGEEYLVYTAESYTATRATLVISRTGSSSSLRVVVEKQ